MRGCFSRSAFLRMCVHIGMFILFSVLLITPCNHKRDAMRLCSLALPRVPNPLLLLQSSPYIIWGRHIEFSISTHNVLNEETVGKNNAAVTFRANGNCENRN